MISEILRMINTSLLSPERVFHASCGSIVNRMRAATLHHSPSRNSECAYLIVNRIREVPTCCIPDCNCRVKFVSFVGGYSAHCKTHFKGKTALMIKNMRQEKQIRGKRKDAANRAKAKLNGK